MTRRPGFVSRLLAIVALAVEGLWRKLGRNLLTMGGVIVGVLALTLIIALGQGMTRLVRTTVSGEESLRQIGLSGGLGMRIEYDADVEIQGEMSEARRARLRRAALARTRPGNLVGRRAQALDAGALAAVAAMEHVVFAEPIVLERYRLEWQDETREATPTLGVDVGRRRYADRVIAGSWFSAPDAQEVVVHEYLAFQWGLVDDADLERLVGTTLVLTPIGGGGAVSMVPDGLVEAVLSRVDLSTLTEEEREALPGIAKKLGRSFLGGREEAGDPDDTPTPLTLEVVGVLRELEPQDPFNVIEDGNAYQVDVFLPRETATALFLSSAVNRELGFSRAVVLVDEARHAEAVEERLRDQGYTAFSVATVVGRIEGFLAGITIAVAILTGIALFVAALGIANTMVTSVLERTREIGLWKAIGATSGQVRLVFLLEAALIGLSGGLIGLGAALLLRIPGEEIAKALIAESSAFPIRGGIFHVPLWLPVAGPALATVIAMVAALYPAHRAARVDPVRALHHE